jgi:hypothetical protein
MHYNLKHSHYIDHVGIRFDFQSFFYFTNHRLIQQAFVTHTHTVCLSLQNTKQVDFVFQCHSIYRKTGLKINKEKTVMAVSYLKCVMVHKIP